MDRVIEINGVELSFDFTDADTVDLFERASARVKQTIDEDMSGLKHSDAIRKVCHAVFDFFNDIFGEGTDREVFGGKCSMNDCLDAFACVYREANRQNQEMVDKKAKYSPNRVQRRQA